MNITEFYKYIENPDLLNNDTVAKLKDVIERYAFFQAARILYLKNLYNLNDDKYKNELPVTSLYSPNRKQLYFLIHSTDKKEKPESSEHIQLQFDNKEESVTISTTQQSYQIFEQAEKMTFDEWLYYLNNTPQTTDNIATTSDIIDNFLKQADSIGRIKATENTSNEDLSELLTPPEELEIISESLANLYYKQGYFEKALKMYEKIILKYPEKSIYFANIIQELKQQLNKN